MFILNLKMFDGEADGTTGSADVTATSNEPVRIEYGKASAQETAPATESNATTQQADGTAEDLDAEFSEMIKGKFKDAYTKSTQKIINKRFAETKALRENLDKSNSVISAVAAKYGLDETDTEGIIKALTDDDAHLRAKADEMGVPVEHLKRMNALEAQNAQYLRAQQEAQAQAQANATIERWRSEEEAFRQIMPNFSLDEEVSSNEDFAKLLQAGVGVQAAYTACHSDEMISGAMQITAQKVAEKVAKGREINQQRPVENGMQAHSGVIRKTNVNDTTKHDREEIARRVAMGEKISF